MRPGRPQAQCLLTQPSPSSAENLVAQATQHPGAPSDQAENERAQKNEATFWTRLAIRWNGGVDDLNSIAFACLFEPCCFQLASEHVIEGFKVLHVTKAANVFEATALHRTPAHDQ